MQPSLSLRRPLVRLMVLGNLGGAVLTFIYFREVDPIAGRVEIGPAELLFFVLGFTLLSVVGRLASGRWMRPLLQREADPTGPWSPLARRRALLMPAFMALLTFSGWAAAHPSMAG